VKKYDIKDYAYADYKVAASSYKEPVSYHTEYLNYIIKKILVYSSNIKNVTGKLTDNVYVKCL